MVKAKTPDELISDVLKESLKAEHKNKMENISKYKAKSALAGLIVIIPLAFLFSWFIQLLWNWLMPLLFSLPIITYWQGIGIFILGRFIFGK